MSDFWIKFLLVLLWPIIGAILVVVALIVFIAAWFLIPFAKVVRTQGKISINTPW